MADQAQNPVQQQPPQPPVDPRAVLAQVQVTPLVSKQFREDLVLLKQISSADLKLRVN